MTNEMKKTICLVMIVKNESNTIKRCIDSVKNHIDYWVIVDTGSTDGTQDIIKNVMEEYGIKGELYERPWVDFGFNRTESLQYSKGKADYRLIIDADDVLSVEEGKDPFADLDKDSYKIKIRLGNIAYYRTQLVRGDQDWVYRGVLHEYIRGPLDVSLTDANLEDCEMHASVSGHTRDLKGETKYYNDALIFEKALLTSSEEELADLKHRYLFYMAQSYRDANMYERSIEAYQKRIDVGGWDEEVYISKYWIAKQKHVLGKSDEEIIDSYIKAWEYRPSRLEALYNVIKFLGSRNRYGYAFALATIGMKSPTCTDILFVEDDIWRWRLPDEYSVLAFYNGNAKEAFNVTSKLIESEHFKNISPDDQERIKKNLTYYQDSLMNSGK